MTEYLITMPVINSVKVVIDAPDEQQARRRALADLDAALPVAQQWTPLPSSTLDHVSVLVDASAEFGDVQVTSLEQPRTLRQIRTAVKVMLHTGGTTREHIERLHDRVLDMDGPVLHRTVVPREWIAQVLDLDDDEQLRLVVNAIRRGLREVDIDQLRQKMEFVQLQSLGRHANWMGRTLGGTCVDCDGYWRVSIVEERSGLHIRGTHEAPGSPPRHVRSPDTPIGPSLGSIEATLRSLIVGNCPAEATNGTH